VSWLESLISRSRFYLRQPIVADGTIDETSLSFRSTQRNIARSAGDGVHRCGYQGSANQRVNEHKNDHGVALIAK
jgi:hypothetical protein